MRALFVSATTLLLVTSAVRASDSYTAKPGPDSVATLEAEWQDPVRNAVVPVKIYFPKQIATLKEHGTPLIVFSHGLGGSREGYSFWAEHWASYGYVVVLPTHVGSDTSLITNRAGGRAGGDAGGAPAGGAGVMDSLRSGISMQSVENRYKDVSFVINVMEKADAGADQEGPDPQLTIFRDKLDMKHIGMAGHSFGAQTTLAEAGETFPAARNGAQPRDERITAAIAMSPQPAMAMNQDKAFGSIKIPVMHITGTLDDSPIGDTKAAERRIPFDHSPFPETYLIIFKGATHMTFAPTQGGTTLGNRLREMRAANAGSTNTPEQESHIHDLVNEATTAFWDATLKGDTQAKTWLVKDFAKVLGDVGTFESKAK